MQRFKMPWFGLQFTAEQTSTAHLFFLQALVNKLLKLLKKAEDILLSSAF